MHEANRPTYERIQRRRLIAEDADNSSATRPQRATTNNVNNCRLLALPREIRDEIWALAAVPKEKIVMDGTAELGRDGQLGKFTLRRHRYHYPPTQEYYFPPIREWLLNPASTIAAMRASCRSMRDEATPVFFKTTDIHIVVRQDTTKAAKRQMKRCDFSNPLHHRFSSLICNISISSPLLVPSGANRYQVPMYEAHHVLNASRTAKPSLTATWMISLFDSVSVMADRHFSRPYPNLLSTCVNLDNFMLQRIQNFGPGDIGSGGWLENIFHCMAPGHWLRHDYIDYRDEPHLAYDRQQMMFSILMADKLKPVNGEPCDFKAGFQPSPADNEDITNIDSWPEVRIYQAALRRIEKGHEAPKIMLRLKVGGTSGRHRNVAKRSVARTERAGRIAKTTSKKKNTSAEH